MKKDFSSQLGKIQNEAIKYIKSVLGKRGTDYQLCDPELYEDDVDEEVFDLPRAWRFGDEFEEYPIVVININEKGELGFSGIGACNDHDGDYEFTTEELSAECLIEIADLVAKLEES